MIQVAERKTSPDADAIRQKADRQIYFWTAAFLLMLAVAAFRFHRFYLFHLAPYFPANFDQLDGLRLVYQAHYDLLKSWPSFSPLIPLAQLCMKGIVVPALGTIFSFAFGATRWSCLLVNFLFFAIGQAAIAVFVWHHLGKSDSLLALGLFLLSGVHFFWAGGIGDFRLDYAGMICMGLAFLAAWHFLQNGKKTSLALAAVFFVMSAFTRSIVAFYLVGTTALFLCSTFAIRLFWKAEASLFSALSKRAAILLMTAILSTVLAVGAFWDSFMSYYVKCKISGEDAMRLRENGVFNWLDRFAFYPSSLLDRFGKIYSAFVAMTLGGLLVNFLRPNLNARARQLTASERSFLFTGILLFICVTLSVIAFATFYVPTPVVIGVLTIPTAVTLTAIISAQFKRSQPKAYSIACVLVFAIAFALYYQETRRPTYLPHAPVPKAEGVDRLQKKAIQLVEARLNKPTQLSWLIMDDGLNQGVFNVFWYEQAKKQLPADLTQMSVRAFPAITWPELQQCLEQADIVVAPIKLRIVPPSFFEYDGQKALRALLPKLQNELKSKFTLRYEKSLGLYDYDVGIYTKN